MTSPVSAFPEVRKFLVAKQREFATAHNVIMDGRDIGTNVLPQAQIKIFMVATPECRAMRRVKEFQEKVKIPSMNPSFKKSKTEIIEIAIEL